MEGLTNVTNAIVAYIPSFLAALGILLVGWLIAILLRNVVRGLLRRTPLNAWLGRWLGGEGAAPGEAAAAPVDAAGAIGAFVYYLVLLITFIGVCEALKLTLITEPLRLLLATILAYLPRVLGAVVLLIVAWAIATIARTLVVRGMRVTRIDQRVADQTEGQVSAPISQTVGEVVYWLIFLIFLPLIVNALGLSLGTGPLSDMIGLFLDVIPRLVAAGGILAIGWFAAVIVRRLVTAALAGLGLDRLSARVGLDRTLGPNGLSRLLGLLAYILILIPAVVGALDALGLTALTAPLTAMLNQFLAVIPLLFFAAVVLGVSYVVARLVADLATAFLAAIGVDTLPARLGMSRVVPTEGRPVSRLVGQLILLVIMLLATIEAADLLHFTAVATLLSAFLVLLGQVLLGLLVLAVGLYLANVLAGVVAASGAPRADLLALITRVAVIALAVPMALKQIGLGDEIVVLAFGLILGGAVLALAVAFGVAFGIGGRGAAEDLVTEWRGQLPPAGSASGAPSLPAGDVAGSSARSTEPQPPAGSPTTPGGQE
jgi:hypothetical protein